MTDGTTDRTAVFHQHRPRLFGIAYQRLAPEERAAFLLHEVFDCDYAEIARILGKSAAACRQTVHRGRERVRRDRPRFAVNEAARIRLLERFFAALQAEDQEAVLALFADDATWTSDGGGKAKAALKTLRGADYVVRFAMGIWRAYLHKLPRTPITLNGDAGVLLSRNGVPVSALSIDTDGVRILAVYTVLNPDKLKGIVAHGEKMQ
jgi:RNA polymerase sigma-70 factor, ECF subfamily